jgi:hypothetical protein
MSDFGVFGSAGGFREATTGSSFSRFREKTVAVDVGASATKAEISRGGFALAEIAVDDERIATFLDDLVVVQTKVVTQTIAPGTAVAQGTAIDVVLARTSDLPVAVIPGVHQAFNNFTMQQLHAQFADVAAVRDLVRTKTDASQLTAAETEALTAALQANNVPIGTAQDETPAAAFTAIQAAFTFQS